LWLWIGSRWRGRGGLERRYRRGGGVAGMLRGGCSTWVGEARKLVLWPRIDPVAQVYTERKQTIRSERSELRKYFRRKLYAPTPTYKNSVKILQTVLLFICNVLCAYTPRLQTHSLLIHAPTSFPFRKTSQKSQ